MTYISKKTQSLSESLQYLLKTSLFAGLLNIFSLLYFIKSSNNEDYGLYILLLSIYALPQVIISGLDESILRFLDEKNTINKRHLIMCTLGFKYLITLPILLIIILNYEFIKYFFNIANSSYTILIIILCIRFTMIPLQNTIDTAILATRRYQFLYIKNILGAVANTIGTILIVEILNSEIIMYATLNTLLIIVSILFILYNINKQSSVLKKINLSNFNLSIIRQEYNNTFKSYSIPLNAVSMLSYIKNHAPNFFLAKYGTLEMITFFNIIKLPFDFIHNYIGNILKKMIPILLRKLNYHTIDGENYARYLLIYGFFTRIILSLILTTFKDHYLMIMNVEESNLVNFIFIILLIDFILQFFMTYLILDISLGKSTQPILIGSIFRFLSLIFLMFVLNYLYGLYALFLAYPLSTIISIYPMIKILMDEWRLNILLKLYLITSLIGSLIIINAFINL